MPARPRYPTGAEPAFAVRPALGRFEDFATVVGTRRPDAEGCWCMAYRDSRVPNRERPAYMRAECATDPGPGVLVYVDDVVAGWCSIAPRARYRRLLHSRTIDRKSTRLNSSHANISYAVFCLKKKKNN